MTNGSSHLSTMRNAFVSALQDGHKFRAITIARGLLAEELGVRQISFISKALSAAPRGALGLKPLKLALLSSSSVQFLHDPLVVMAFLGEIDLQIYSPAFGQIHQEIRNPKSGLYAFSPDVVIVLVEGMDWVPEIYRGYLDGTKEGFDAIISRFADELKDLVYALRERSNATVLVNNFAPPVFPHLGILDAQTGMGQVPLVHRLNQVLSSACQETTGAYAVDYAGLVARWGALRWYDDRMEQYAKAPVALGMLPYLAREYGKFLRAITGGTKKCLVLDLDNTLWGGVLGEDGLDGISLSPTYPGSAYLAFQREILNLQRRGVLLAIASKNNLADVEEVFVRHPHMILKRHHFAAVQIHWNAKADSLEEIARQINIGLEHIVFVDDNPAECEEVARRLPMVTTIMLPKEPESFVRALLEEGLFDTITVSTEDRRRGELYRQREQAEMLRQSSASLEEFYRNLEMEVAFAPVDKTTLARSAQLTQKTNQFNITTLRFSESDLADRLKRPEWLLITVKVSDRFGDQGIVGLMMAQVHGGALEIETFLLSCRVIGRKIETAMLSHLGECAVRRGARLLRGRVIPTAKNAPARALFEQHGFEKLDELQNGEVRWILDLTRNMIPSPEWMHVRTDLQPLTQHQ